MSTSFHLFDVCVAQGCIFFCLPPPLTLGKKWKNLGGGKKWFSKLIYTPGVAWSRWCMHEKYKNPSQKKRNYQASWLNRRMNWIWKKFGYRVASHLNSSWFQGSNRDYGWTHGQRLLPGNNIFWLVNPYLQHYFVSNYARYLCII